MWKKLNYILNIAIGSCIGVFVGHGIYVFWDYRTRPGLYAMRSAPWYASILTSGMFTIALLTAAVILKLIARWKSKRE